MSIERARAHLAKYGLEDRIRELTVSSATVALAAEALGCEPARIAKTLSFELGEGRLVNLAAGNGHPAEIMDMSFAVQALAAEWLTRQTGLEKKVYAIPDSIDDEIGRAKLAALGLSIDTLTPEQEAYLNSWSV